MIGPADTFSYEQALAMLPVVQDVTRAAVGQIEGIVNQVQSREEMDRRKPEIEDAVASIIEGWRTEIIDLGCEPKGLWLVDWDSGDGYYCWRYPEDTIGHFHSYEDGFEGRIPIN